MMETSQKEVEPVIESPSSNLPTINTDNLPITPVKTNVWVNNYMTPSPNSSENNLPNTDNLLDISVPKITLLGKEQAKKRLHAFSVSKQNNLNCSPHPKKKITQPKFLLQPNEIQYNENGEKTEAKFILVPKPPRKSK